MRQRTLSSASLGHQARIYIVPEFRIESGRVLKEVPVAYHCWGRLNESRTNVMLICHALTGSSDVSDWYSVLTPSTIWYIMDLGGRRYLGQGMRWIHRNSS